MIHYRSTHIATDFLGLLSLWFWISQRSSIWQVFLYFCSLWIYSRLGPIVNAQQIPASQIRPQWNFCLSWLQVFIVPLAYFGRISGWCLFTYTRTYPIKDSLAKLDDRMHPSKCHELNFLFFRDMHNYAAGINIGQQHIQHNLPSSSSKTWSKPTFCPRACFALAPQTMALFKSLLNAYRPEPNKTNYFNCLAISLWIALQKSSMVHFPWRSTTGAS